jgi:hypothetical protein
MIFNTKTGHGLARLLHPLFPLPMRATSTLPLFLGLLLGTLLPPSQGADSPRPNILIAIADDWSFGHAGAYNCQWVKTPGFDRVAKEGVLFNRFYTPSAKCSPSRSAILTGRNPWQLGAAANHWPTFPPEFRTYPETLAAQGYFVGMTMKGWGPEKPGTPMGSHAKW